MVERRPDWVLSRQRAWGVPLAIFVEKKTGQVLNDPAVFKRIEAAFEAEGADAWFTSPPERFLGEGRKPDDYEQVTDILDVWFDSGSTHVFTVENPIDPALAQGRAGRSLSGRLGPASRLVPVLAAGKRRHARARALQGRARPTALCWTSRAAKCPSRLGNTLAPQVIAEKNGADILRLWAASSDFTEDLRIGQDIIKANVEAYRRLRNTIRFMLANLAGFDEKERIGLDKMPELERFMLARLAELDGQVREAYAGFDFNRVDGDPVQFLHQRTVGLLFRHPQGRALLRRRRQRRAAAPRAP